jgi:uncharacterized paraquat-inducible protein A
MEKVRSGTYLTCNAFHETNYYRILYGAVRSLWDQKMHGISTLVFITAIVVPSL